MKIAILTFAKAINYGAVLQAVALSEKLKSYGAKVLFLNYNNHKIKKANSIFDFNKILNLKYTLAHLYNLPCAVKRNIEFKKFREKNLNFTNEDLNKFDIVITGSDQVWNYNLTDNDWFYFLNFKKQNTKKIAYAASFGISEIDCIKKTKIANFLNDFDYISVRENSAVSLVKEISRNKVTAVLDPTLLLTKNEWKRFFKIPKEKPKYIFVYTVENDRKLWEFAHQLSLQTKLPIYSISYSKLHKQKAQYNFSAGPKEWLEHIFGAKYVVTNSFHAVAFSINFQKQFFFSTPNNTSSRITDITNRYNLSHRDISKCKNHKRIDYTLVNQILKNERRLSEEFIKKFIN